MANKPFYALEEHAGSSFSFFDKDLIGGEDQLLSAVLTQ